MKHAGAVTLDSLEELLVALRAHVPPLVERRRGVFYLKSTAFLHFHEDPAGLFGDLRLAGTDFERLPVSTAAQQRALLARVARHVKALGTVGRAPRPAPVRQ